MTATKPLEMSLPVCIKKEKDEKIDDDCEESDVDDDCSSTSSSLLQPSILNKNCFSNCEPQDEFHHLTSMVRRVYFSYLHKSVINNYNVCAEKNTRNISRAELKKFASQLELQAVKECLEASLYRQSMLKIIADVKNNTAHYEVHNKLALFLDTPPSTRDATVQTIVPSNPANKIDSSTQIDNELHWNDTIKSTAIEDKLIGILQNNEINMKVKQDDNEESVTDTHQETMKKFNQENIETDNVNTSVREIFGELIEDNENTVNDDEESRDSLMQHMEDMFCESEDSSDLMTLIEKHSGVSKINMDTEIGKMCRETHTIIDVPTKTSQRSRKSPKSELTDTSNINTISQGVNKRKMSFTNYKRMRKRASMDPGGSDVQHNDDVKEDKHMKKMRGIWFVERVHQVSILKAKMMELSANNYRKHGKVRTKFRELFGESDEEEMMPDSPIRIEEHLIACKERIAPWVVKHLMPFYTKKMIKDRLLFKAVAKHISDMLIIKTTFPEEDCVCQHIKDYFRNKTCINVESDIYM